MLAYSKPGSHEPLIMGVLVGSGQIWVRTGVGVVCGVGVVIGVGSICVGEGVCARATPLGRTHLSNQNASKPKRQ